MVEYDLTQDIEAMKNREDWPDDRLAVVKKLVLGEEARRQEAAAAEKAAAMTAAQKEAEQMKAIGGLSAAEFRRHTLEKYGF